MPFTDTGILPGRAAGVSTGLRARSSGTAGGTRGSRSRGENRCDARDSMPNPSETGAKPPEPKPVLTAADSKDPNKVHIPSRAARHHQQLFDPPTEVGLHRCDVNAAGRLLATSEGSRLVIRPEGRLARATGCETWLSAVAMPAVSILRIRRPKATTCSPAATPRSRSAGEESLSGTNRHDHSLTLSKSSCSAASWSITIAPSVRVRLTRFTTASRLRPRMPFETL